MTRDELLEVLRDAVVGHPVVQAAWVGGSDATGRTDRWSDIDLVLLVAPHEADEAFALVEGVLESSGGIARRYSMQESSEADYRQRFYRPAPVAEWCMVDLCVMRPDRLSAWVDRDRHGTPVVWHDPDGRLAHRSDSRVPDRRAARLAELRDRVPMFAHMPAKHLARGRVLEASNSYRAFLLTPLVEVLRIRYCRERFDFGWRYLLDDLPPAVVARLERLAYPASPEAMATMIPEVREWLSEELS